ncbi:MAG: hypothetical protein Fur0042_08560 [Cyanophyceae cyanobacterium]
MGLICLMTFGFAIPFVLIFTYAIYRSFPKELWIEDGRLYSTKKELRHGPLIQSCEVEKVALQRRYGRLRIWYVQLRCPKQGFDVIQQDGRRARRKSSEIVAVNYVWTVGGSPAIFALLERLVQEGIQDKGAYGMLREQQMHLRDINGIVRTT